MNKCIVCNLIFEPKANTTGKYCSSMCWQKAKPPMNGIKDDNRLENLAVMLRTTHGGCVTCPRCRYDFKIR